MMAMMKVTLAIVMVTMVLMVMTAVEFAFFELEFEICVHKLFLCMRNRGSSIEIALAHKIGEVICCIMATDEEGIETLQSRLARAEEQEEAKPAEEEVVENQEDRDEEEEEAKPAEEDPVASQEAPLDLDFPKCMDDDDVPLRQPL